MDCPPRHDRTPPGLRARIGNSEAYPRNPETRLGQGTPICRPSPLWPSQRRPHGRFRRRRHRATRSRSRPVPRIVPRTQNSHQKRIAQPKTSPRRGQHLRRRIALPRRNPPPPPRLIHCPRAVRPPPRRREGGPERSDRSRRLLHLRLRRRRRRSRLLPTPASRLRTRRGALPDLQNSYQTYRNRRPQQPLLPQVPEVKFVIQSGAVFSGEAKDLSRTNSARKPKCTTTRFCDEHAPPHF